MRTRSFRKKISAAALFFSLPLSAVQPASVDFPPQQQVWYFVEEGKGGAVTYSAAGKLDAPDSLTTRFIPEAKLSLQEYFKKQSAGLKTRQLLQTGELLLYEWENEAGEQGMTQLRKLPSGIRLFEIRSAGGGKSEKTRRQWRQILENYTFKAVAEKISFNIQWEKGGKEWKRQEGENSYFFYPEGENSESWNERLTVNIWNFVDLEPQEFFERVQKALIDKYGDTIAFRLIEKDGDQLFFEWSGENIKELYKLKHVRPGVTTLIRYTVKDPKRDTAEWEKNLKNSGVTVRYRSVVIPL